MIDVTKLGLECDKAIDSKSIELINYKIDELQTLLKKSPETFKSYLYYYLGNLALEKSVLEQERFDGWQNRLYPASAILAINSFRNSYELIKSLDHYVKFEVQTNLANCLSKFGRYIEAMPLWLCDFSLKGDNPFVSSYNKAKVLRYLSRYINDDYHAFYYKFKAYETLDKLQNNISNINHNEIKKSMEEPDILSFLQQGNKHINQGYRGIEQVFYEPKYAGKNEKLYREWCLKNCLFLNHLNDITVLPIAGQDIIQFPNYSSSIKDGPYLSAAFSGIKRDYCFARFMLYEGIFERNCPKYESKDLYLTDTGDDVDYSMSIEKIKTAFRNAFSVFDSLAVLMFIYFRNSNHLPKIYFSPKFIGKQLSSFDNPFITSLYWLACDLTDIDPDNNNWQAPNPDAKKLRQIRKTLEHNWLRVAGGISIWGNESGHDYAVVINKEELNNLAMKSFQMVRSALLYFILAVKYHESKKQNSLDFALSQMVPLWK